MKILLASAAFMVISAASGAAAAEKVSVYNGMLISILYSCSRHCLTNNNSSFSSLQLHSSSFPKTSKLKHGCVVKAVEPGLGVSTLLLLSSLLLLLLMMWQELTLYITPPLTQVQMIINLSQVIVNGTVGIAGRLSLSVTILVILVRWIAIVSKVDSILVTSVVPHMVRSTTKGVIRNQ